MLSSDDLGGDTNIKPQRTKAICKLGTLIEFTLHSTIFSPRTFKHEAGRSKTTKILTRLPMVYLHNPEQPLPRVGLSRPYQRHQQEHTLKSIEATPFLPSIAAYRYKR